MPTQKPRVALTLDPETVAQLAVLAQGVGKPLSTAVAEVLKEIAPQLADLGRWMKAVKLKDPAAAKEAVRHMMGDQFAEMMLAVQPELFGKSAGRGR